MPTVMMLDWPGPRTGSELVTSACVYGCAGSGMQLDPGLMAIGKSSPNGLAMEKMPCASLPPCGRTAAWREVANAVNVTELLGSLLTTR